MKGFVKLHNKRNFTHLPNSSVRELLSDFIVGSSNKTIAEKRQEIFKRFQHFYASPVNNTAQTNWYRDKYYSELFLVDEDGLHYNFSEPDSISKTGGNGSALEHANCHQITPEEAVYYSGLSFVLEMIGQPIFVSMGFFFNSVAACILYR